jgi:Sec-independent protein translocase protein TatA
MGEDFKYKEIPTGLPAETALDLASTVANLIPGFGGAVGNVLSGLSADRKIERVKEVVRDIASELRDFKSEASQAYVKTEEFEDLLEKTLRQAAEERQEEKRKVLASFLTDAVKKPGEAYEEQTRFLRMVEALQPSHMTLLRALSRPPTTEEEDGIVGSVIGTLQRRIPQLKEDQIKELVTQTNDLRITALASVHGMTTARGAADLRHSITPFGQRLVSFIKEA